MIQRLRKLISNDVSLLVAAGMAAQVVNLAAYPLLTFFFTPADFGLYSAVVAVSTFIGVALLLRIETLYQIADAEEEEDHLIAALTVSLLLTLVVFIVVLLFGAQLIGLAVEDFEPQNWHWSYAILIALLTFLNGFFSLAREYNAKNGRYGRLAADRGREIRRAQGQPRDDKGDGPLALAWRQARVIPKDQVVPVLPAVEGQQRQ
ncbi:hypothetical protein FAP39_14155 [Shimia litoralis]|uniref:Uncharacterized protein n=1 Tax=Shimia litoralis TaxID=420403 RepID=A0A4U7MWT4_9RHOB|nr:hypothetical protein [Shimia litoralis]TKZ17433.1 hypothetical protein FAP39_14155 [Shimia litoralis]